MAREASQRFETSGDDAAASSAVRRASAGPPPTPAEADAAFVDALRRAGCVGELSAGLEAVLMQALQPRDDADARRLDLLERYYRSDDPETSARRRTADRFFLHRASDGASASDLVEALCEVAPEIGAVDLERIGGDDGPLVLRNAEHVSAVQDDYEDDLDTDEVDLRDLDETPSIAVRGLVAATNGLLERAGVSERLVPLPMDDEREAYLGVGVEQAIALQRAGYLELDELEALMELTGW